MIAELKNIFGKKVTAINVNGHFIQPVYIPTHRMKFCEAVNLSFDTPMRLVDRNLGCPGARRSVGFDNNDTLLAKTISENNKIPVHFIFTALKTISKSKGIKHINLGLSEAMEDETKPDLYIIYTQPTVITKLMHTLAKAEIKPSLRPYSLLSVCGNVFSSCYKNRVVSLSFGCPESRKHGGIGNYEVVLGLPFQYALQLIKVF